MVLSKFFRFCCLLESLLLVFPMGPSYTDVFAADSQGGSCDCKSAKGVCGLYKSYPSQDAQAIWGNLGETCDAIDQSRVAWDWSLVGTIAFSATAAACISSCACSLAVKAGGVGAGCIVPTKLACETTNILASTVDIIATIALAVDGQNFKQYWEKAQTGLTIGTDMVFLGMGAMQLKGALQLQKQIDSGEFDSSSVSPLQDCLMAALFTMIAAQKGFDLPAQKDSQCLSCDSVNQAQSDALSAAADGNTDSSGTGSQGGGGTTGLQVDPTTGQLYDPSTGTIYAPIGPGTRISDLLALINHPALPPLPNSPSLPAGTVASGETGANGTGSGTGVRSLIGTGDGVNSSSAGNGNFVSMLGATADPFPSGLMASAMRSTPFTPIINSMPHLNMVPAGLNAMGTSLDKMGNQFARGDNPVSVILSSVQPGVPAPLAAMIRDIGRLAKEGKITVGNKGSLNAALTTPHSFHNTSSFSDPSGSSNSLLGSPLATLDSSRKPSSTSQGSPDFSHANPKASEKKSFSPGIVASKIIDDDIWHSSSAESLFQIVSQKIDQVRGRVAQVEWSSPLNRAFIGLPQSNHPSH